jgi:hypothetical protein
MFSSSVDQPLGLLPQVQHLLIIWWSRVEDLVGVEVQAAVVLVVIERVQV